MYKELKLKANHNAFDAIQKKNKVVIKCTKSWSWKQITTLCFFCIFVTSLLSNVQRAEVESKSQRWCSYACYIRSCYQMYKELKLKANHNGVWPQPLKKRLLSNVQRAEVESKSQRNDLGILSAVRCYQMYKELKLKANHNLTLFNAFVLSVVIKCTKSWSWKQITTSQLCGLLPGLLLSNVQRAEVESKSQRHLLGG